MDSQEIAQLRTEYESMVTRGFNDYQECLRLLDIIEANKAQKQFQFLVTITGVKSPGPHAGFEYYGDAVRYARYYPTGGTVNGKVIEFDPASR